MSFEVSWQGKHYYIVNMIYIKNYNLIIVYLEVNIWIRPNEHAYTHALTHIHMHAYTQTHTCQHTQNPHINTNCLKINRIFVLEKRKKKSYFGISFNTTVTVNPMAIKYFSLEILIFRKKNYWHIVRIC